MKTDLQAQEAFLAEAMVEMSGPGSADIERCIVELMHQVDDAKLLRATSSDISYLVADGRLKASESALESAMQMVPWWDPS
jgi:hypothetical protein